VPHGETIARVPRGLSAEPVCRMFPRMSRKADIAEEPTNFRAALHSDRSGSAVDLIYTNSALCQALLSSLAE
jgi:hypothetical protein